jgi:hypothetical protein
LRDKKGSHLDQLIEKQTLWSSMILLEPNAFALNNENYRP